MSNSQRIVAINRDENAPIFKSADFGIVGDALEILPVLTRQILEKNAVLH
jgi:electron transfer flavoprotein alpha subunit